MSNDYLTIKEIAEIFGVSIQAVYKWIKVKGLECYKVSKHRTRIRPENILKFLKGYSDSEDERKYFRKSIKHYLILKYDNPYKAYGI